MSRLHIIYKARLLPQPPVKKVNSSRSFRRHALVADDCVSSRLLTRAVLRSFDFTVDCVAHGRSALESSRVQPYSVVFLDAQMPKMSRPEIVAHLKGAWTQSWERPRFVVIGADKQSEESELWRACGVTDYLPKPVTIPALKNCLKTMRTEVQRSHAEEGKGGGELIDQGTHLLDLSLGFLGSIKLEYSSIPTYFWDMSVEDNAFISVSNEKGNLAFLQASSTEWKNMFSLEVYGRSGKLDIEGLGRSYGLETLTFHKMLPAMGPPESTTWTFPGEDESWATEIAEFLTDLRTNSTKSANLESSLSVLEIIGEIYARDSE